MPHNETFEGAYHNNHNCVLGNKENFGTEYILKIFILYYTSPFISRIRVYANIQANKNQVSLVYCYKYIFIVGYPLNDLCATE